MQLSEMTWNDDASNRITLREVIETYLRQAEGFVNKGDPELNGLNYHVDTIMYNLGYHRSQPPVSRRRGDGLSTMLSISAEADIPTISTIIRAYLVCLYQNKHGYGRFPDDSELRNETEDMLLSMRVDVAARPVNPFLPRQKSEMMNIETIVRIVLTQRSPLNSAFEESAHQDRVVEEAVNCLLRGAKPTRPLRILPTGLSAWFKQLSLMKLFAEYCLGQESLVDEWLGIHLAMMNSVSFGKP
jgi:hypothetical protein